MENSICHKQLLLSIYFAPRGKKRLMFLGNQIASRYLSPTDLLIGLVGDSGSGKSLIIKGMFPGLELSNDDEGVNIRPLPLLREDADGFFSPHTYHMDARFESAFTQLHVLSNAVMLAIKNGKRVVIEHFDILYPFLQTNADILIGIGEEVFVTRPTIFGPEPKELSKSALKSIKYRKMAHTAEEIACAILEDDYGISSNHEHNDIIHGFVIELNQKPNVDLEELENKVKKVISSNVDISYYDEGHILIGDKLRVCTGPRIHVRNTSEIVNFRIVKEYQYDSLYEKYCIVGMVGCENIKDVNNINNLDIFYKDQNSMETNV